MLDSHKKKEHFPISFNQLQITFIINFLEINECFRVRLEHNSDIYNPH